MRETDYGTSGLLLALRGGSGHGGLLGAKWK